MKNIQKIKSLFARNVYASIAIELVFAIVLTAIPLGSSEAAAGQLTSRSVQLSDSGPSGSSITSGVGSGTNVDYKLGFTVASAGTVGGIVIDFCSNSALSFDTACTAPTGFDAKSASVQLYNQTNLGTGAFSVYTTTPLANRLILTRATATAPSGASSLEIGNGTTNGITNPSTTGSFYARIYTYDTAAHAQAHSQTASDNYVVDYGGVALTTATVITITARVQESLIFCVSSASPTSNCGGTSSPALTLGHGSGNKIIDSSAVDTATMYSQLSTNAGAGAIVRIHSNNASGGLETTSGSIIPPSNSGAATTPTSAGQAMSAGTAAFGLAIATGTGGTGTVAPAAPYSGATASSYYGMDTTTSGSNVTTTFGSTAEQSTAPVSNVNNTWTFAATASNLTPAGLYAANIAAIATGTF